MLRLLKKAWPVMRWFVIVSVLSVVLLEALLQLAALTVDKRQSSGVARWLYPDRVRVVAMGDSNTYGLYYSAAEAWPAVFEQRWNAQHPEMPVEVINLAFPGTNSSRVLKSMPDVLATFQPDVITVMVGVNDFWMAPVDTSAESSDVSALKSWLLEHSRTAKLFYMIMRQPYNASLLEMDKEYRAAEYDPSYEKIFRDALEGKRELPLSDKPKAVRYGDRTFDIGYVFSGKQGNPADAMHTNFNRMADLASAHQAKLVFITYAYFEMPQKAANMQMKVVAKERNIPLINPAKHFREACAQSEKLCHTLFVPDFHPTDEGHRLIASTVMEEIALLVTGDTPKELENHDR